MVYLPGSGFTAGDVRDADALVIRTRTRCNRELLEGSKVKFIATATIGFDHIDVDYCDEAGIVWKNCPGCNAGSVEQYLHSVLLLLKRRKGVRLEESCLGSCWGRTCGKPYPTYGGGIGDAGLAE